MPALSQPSSPPLPDGSPKNPRHSWTAVKHPVLWFCGKFSLLMLLYYSVSLMPFFGPALSGYLVATARISNGILHFFGETSQLSGTTIWSANHAITVLPICTAWEVVWFLCATILAFPAPWLRKIGGILAGAPILLLLNLARIVTLYSVGVHFPGLFDAVHEEVWPAVFILTTLLLCAGWIHWARSEPPTDAAA